MKKRIDRIDPVSAAKITSVMYTFLGLLFSPLILISALMNDGFGGMGFVMGVAFVLFMILVYGVMGFLGAALMSWLYNVVAPRIGGVEIEVSERPW